MGLPLGMHAQVHLAGLPERCMAVQVKRMAEPRYEIHSNPLR